MQPETETTAAASHFTICREYTGLLITLWKGEGMTNEELVEKIQAGKDVKENMEQLWNQNTGMVAHIAWRYRERAELDDLMQEGFLGLQEAVRRYDQTKGVPFINYAAYWIKQVMVRYIKGNGIVRIPEGQQSRIIQYNRIVQAFQQKYCRMPTEAEMSHAMDMTVKQLRAFKRLARMANIGSLDRPVGEEEDRLSFHEIIASGIDEQEVVLNSVEHEQVSKMLWGMVEELPGQQSGVIKKYYKENMTLKEIGEANGVTIERIRQLKEQGLRTLRNPKRSRRLREFYPDDRIYSSGLSGNGIGTFSRSWTSSTERTAMKMIEKEQELRASRLNYYREMWGEDFEENRDIIDRLVESDLENARCGEKAYPRRSRGRI